MSCFFAPNNIKDDENQQALPYDPLDLTIGPITRLMAKKIKEALIRLIHNIWTKISIQTSTKDEHTLINVTKEVNTKFSWAMESF